MKFKNFDNFVTKFKRKNQKFRKNFEGKNLKFRRKHQKNLQKKIKILKKNVINFKGKKSKISEKEI